MIIGTKFCGYSRDARRLYRFDKGDEPDLTPMYEAAKLSNELGQDALAWYKEQAAAQQPLIQRAADRADAVSLAQLDAMKTQTRLGEEAEAYRKDTFQPVEKRLVGDAMSFNTDAERERLAGLAGADVAQAFDAQRGQMRRDLGRVGLSPEDGGFQAATTELGAREALATAQLKNKARSDARTVGRAQLMDAASIGRNLPSQQATAAQLALTAGDRSVGNAQVPVSLASANTRLAGEGYDAALRGTGQSANIYGSAARTEAEAGDDSALWGAVGKVGGALIAASDKDAKTSKKPVKGEVALAAARRMPVKSWKYKKGGPHDDGGKRHIGPMAQDVHAALGNKVAPGGKAVDLISLAGVTLSAVKALDKKVDRLAGKKPQRA